jgi:hypothetical protein
LNYRHATLSALETLPTASGVKSIDIDIADIISRINIQLRLKNNGSTQTGHGAAALTKVEVVDGSDVLYSTDGYCGRAIDYYGVGKLPYDIADYVDDEDFELGFNIHFGRHLFDELLALDPKKFSNPQLKISFNRALGGSSPDAATLTVEADVFDEKAVMPKGFLMTKEIQRKTPSASAHEYIELPTDYVYRQIMLKALYPTKNPHEIYSNIKLTEDVDKRVPLNHLATDLFHIVNAQLQPIEERIRGWAITAGSNVYSAITLEGLPVGVGNTATATQVTCSQLFGGRFTAYLSTNSFYNIVATGFAPHGALSLPICKKDMIEDFYDATKLKSLKLDVTYGSSPGTADLVTVVQQLRKY